MRSKDHVNSRMLPAPGKGGKVLRLRHFIQAPKVGGLSQRRDQPVKAVGTGQQAFAFQFGNQRVDCVQRQLAAFDPAR